MRPPLTIPRIIDRPRILAQLQRALETGHALLTAPAGYGKSAILRALASERPSTHLIILTPTDKDLAAFSARLQPLMQPDHTILLDDVHLLDGERETCAWLQKQLNQQRPRWILAGRRLPFDTKALLVSGEAVRLGRETLAFSAQETGLLLGTQHETTAQWQARLGGWPLGISLLSRLPEGANRLPETESHLFNYLATSVFGQLPPSLNRFLQITAVPLHFNLDLAAALWDGADDPADLLAEAQRRNLFLQPAAQPGWLRYHDLIRDFLLREKGDGVTAVAEKTIAWFAAAGDNDAAIEQALDCQLPHRAAQIIETLPLSHVHKQTRYQTYRRWIRALDDDALAANPILLVRFSNISLMMGQDADAEESHPDSHRHGAAAACTPLFP